MREQIDPARGGCGRGDCPTPPPPPTVATFLDFWYQIDASIDASKRPSGSREPPTTWTETGGGGGGHTNCLTFTMPRSPGLHAWVNANWRQNISRLSAFVWERWQPVVETVTGKSVWMCIENLIFIYFNHPYELRKALLMHFRVHFFFFRKPQEIRRSEEKSHSHARFNTWK